MPGPAPTNLVALGDATFESAIAKGIVFVDFWATWCGPCRTFAPIFEQAAARHPDITFAKVDTEHERALAGSLGISAIPTLMIFKDGALVFSQPGVLPAAALDDLARQVRALDVAAARAAQQRKTG